MLPHAAALPRAQGAYQCYAWQTEQQRAVGPATPAPETALVKAFGVHKHRYGTHRLQIALRKKGHRVDRQRLYTALARQDLRTLQPKVFTLRTTGSIYGRRCAPNRLLDQSKPTQADRFWVSGITYLPLANGTWAYRCAFQGGCTKHIAGWQVRNNMHDALLNRILQRDLLAQRPALGLIVHSDRGRTR